MAGLQVEFSIIIPLEFHRGQWEECWRGWSSQTFPRSSFEIVLAVPPDFQHRKGLDELKGAALIKESQYTHDVDLSADGAAAAHGTYLFFTESHCWPEPDVLERCFRAFAEHPEWAGFSCGAVGIRHNRLSHAEADMYEADIASAMDGHPWRRILDQCFVTRRDAYFACGGFEKGLGHFSEWALASRYAVEGYRLGYLAEARVHHYYCGSLSLLNTFTRDFVHGEFDYLCRKIKSPGSTLFDVPHELRSWDEFDAGLSRAVVRTTLSDALRRKGSGRPMLRWLVPALFGRKIRDARSEATVLGMKLALAYALLFGRSEQRTRRFKAYVAAVIQNERLRCIAEVIRQSPALSSCQGEVVSRKVGFYPQENYLGEPFNWSKTEAAIRLHARPGSRTLRIGCLPVRSLSHDIDLRFYLDGVPLPPDAVCVEAHDLELLLLMPSSGTAVLVWICLPFATKADPRTLGLPVKEFQMVSVSPQEARLEVESHGTI